MRKIKSYDDLSEFIKNFVTKKSVTDANPLFIVACEKNEHKNLQKTIGYAAALNGADVILFQGPHEKAYDGFVSLFADGIFAIRGGKNEFFFEAQLGEEKKTELALDFPHKKIGAIYCLNGVNIP